MFRKKWFLTITTLLLLTGAAFAQNGTDDRDSDDARSECKAERQEAYADADEDYQEERDEAESAEDNASARQERDEEYAEADEDYRECIADHEEDRAEEEDDSDDLPIPDSHSGRHVAFDVTSDGIANYSVGDQDLFDAIYGDGPADWDEYKQDGASIKLEGDDTELKVSDTPTGVLRFEADDGTVTIELVDGLSVREALRDRSSDDDADDESDNDTDDEDDSDRRDAARDQIERHMDHSGHGKVHLIIEGPDNLTAHLFVEEGYTYDNGTVTSPEEVRSVLTGAPGLRERHNGHSLAGIADGRIAAQVDVPGKGRAAMGAEFADVNVSIEETDRGLKAHVDRADPEGRTILFTLEQGALGDLDALTVLFDGEPIGLADDAEDVLDTSDGVAEYLILVGGDGAEVLVQVPHFSPHTIELQSSVEAISIPGPSGALVMTGILGLAAAVQAVRRR